MPAPRKKKMIWRTFWKLASATWTCQSAWLACQRMWGRCITTVLCQPEKKSSIFGHIKEKRYSWASKREAVLPLFFWGLSSLRALGSNTAFLLGAQKHRFSFWARLTGYLFGHRAKKKSGIVGHIKEKLYSWAPKKEKRYLTREPLSYSGTKEKRYFWAPKREEAFDPRAPKLLRPKKKSGSFGHPKEKRYFRAPKREAVFDPKAPKLLRPEMKLSIWNYVWGSGRSG